MGAEAKKRTTRPLKAIIVLNRAVDGLATSALFCPKKFRKPIVLRAKSNCLFLRILAALCGEKLAWVVAPLEYVAMQHSLRHRAQRMLP